MRNLIILIVLASFIGRSYSQEKYIYSADLKNISEDRVSIELLPPAVKEQEVIFSFPRVIPGSYSEKSFGKYIDDFAAFDARGRSLKIKRLNKNQFRISNASKLAKISYKVNDTWDTPDKDFVFQPGGSNIEAGSNVVMNNHAFFGYLEGYSELPLEIKISKPASMYASTHLEVNRNIPEQDLLSAKNYVYLADNPVFYCKPDTSSFMVGKSRINISVFSATGKIRSEQLISYLQPIAKALQKFFGILPVDSYQFLFYFEDPDKALSDKEKGGGGYGALEHNYSSLYFLPETGYEPQLKSMINDVSSHEFLHILTPLNLHSEQIEHFDFVNPKMSKQLWLYEGVTEYFSNLVQVQNGLITEKKFFQNMRDKINEASGFGDFAMTTMSERVLEEKYQARYSSVYSRGALIGFLLDILIREKTNQQKDLKKVVQELAGRYGPGKPFKDDQFLAEFVAAADPGIQPFVDDHINGDKPLPYAVFLEKLGYRFEKLHRTDIYIIGRMGLKYDEPAKSFVFKEVEKNNLGIKDDDQFISIDNKVVTEANIDEIWEEYFQGNSSRSELSILIKRKGKEMELKGLLGRGYMESKNYIAPLESSSNEQKIFLSRLLKES